MNGTSGRGLDVQNPSALILLRLGSALSRPTDPNALWCADYKGEFLLGKRKYCYPLTITDFASRYLPTCEALLTTQEKFAFTVFERTFRESGLPQVIRTDNRLGLIERALDNLPVEQCVLDLVEHRGIRVGHQRR